MNFRYIPKVIKMIEGILTPSAYMAKDEDFYTPIRNERHRLRARCHLVDDVATGRDAKGQSNFEGEEIPRFRTLKRSFSRHANDSLFLQLVLLVVETETKHRSMGTRSLTPDPS